MGGCKCSYRECKVSSDSKTHFFHYPVLDVERCLKWITNARRPEFEDLTPSQIRNRVICQHHFKDNMFMNFKHNKLIHNAVPTEDGPHMTSSNESIKENLKIRTKYTTRSVDLPTTNREATTLIVNESPFNGYTFSQPDNKIQRSTENYVEFLTRKQDGLLEIARRRMVENLNTTIKNKSLCRSRKRGLRMSVKNEGLTSPITQLHSTKGPIIKTGNNADIKTAVDNSIISKKDQGDANQVNTEVRINDVGKHTTLNQILESKENTPIMKSETDADVKVNDNNSILIKKDETVEKEINISQSELKESAKPGKQLHGFRNGKNIPSSKLINIIHDEKIPLNRKPSINPPVARSQVLSQSNFTPLQAESANNISSYDLYHEPDSTQPQMCVLPALDPEVNLLPSKNHITRLSNRSIDNTNSKLSQNRRKIVTLLKDSPVYNAVEVPVIFTDLEHKDENSPIHLESNNVKFQNKNHSNVHLVEPMNVSETMKAEKTIHKIFEEDIPADVKVNMNLIEKIEQNSREIAELKNLILNGCETVVENNKKRMIVRRQSTEEETRKVELYEEISKYLSPDVSSLVHNELFPRKRRKCWNSKC